MDKKQFEIFQLHNSYEQNVDRDIDANSYGKLSLRSNIILQSLGILLD